MKAAILTFDGFNELDSFVALALLNRVPGWKAELVSDAQRIVSMNGVVVDGVRGLDGLPDYDVVLIGSGMRTREVAADAGVMGRIRLDPTRQIVGAQCSGALILAKLGLIGDVSVCTDVTSKPWVVEAGVRVIDAPFFAHGNVATAGGCIAAQYLAAWVIARGAGVAAARAVIDYVAPVGEKAETVERLMGVIAPFLGEGDGGSFAG